MSETVGNTMYDISGSIGTPQQQDGFSMQLTTAAGMTDAAALALTEAINSVSWPAGVTCSVTVYKNVQSTVVSLGVLDSAPAEFI
jgi:hypothetical protein